VGVTSVNRTAYYSLGLVGMLNREQIESILLAELDEAREKHRRSAENLRAITSEIPTCIPSPDGALRIKKAGEEHRCAFEALRKALERWNVFIVHGNVPDDFRRTESGYDGLHFLSKMR
jgi:hypothetical protein